MAATSAQGNGWRAEAHTVSDPDVKDLIYATGTVTIQKRCTVWGKNPNNVSAKVYSLDNRAARVINGRVVYARGQHTYKQNDAQSALNDLISKLSIIGRQSS